MPEWTQGTSDTSLQGRCETLWSRTVSENRPTVDHDEARERSESYCLGHRITRRTWKRELSGHEVSVIETKTLMLSPGSDVSSSERTIEISRASRLVCVLKRRGAIHVEKFGDEERYCGSEDIPEEPWKLHVGEFPAALM